MIDFPASPTNGQIFNAPNGVAYQYSATYSSWLAQSAAPGVGPYLPLTGGTLTGSLFGTNGFFTDTVVGGYVLFANNQTNETGFTVPFGIRQGNSGSGTNYTELHVNQNAVNDMAIEVVDQANTKGVLRLQPFGGTVGVGGVPTEKFTVVSSDNLTGSIVGVYANNLSQGVGIHWDGIRKMGTATDLSINIDAKGAGFVGLGFNCTGYTTLGRDPPAAANNQNVATTAWVRANVGSSGTGGTDFYAAFNTLTGMASAITTIIPPVVTGNAGGYYNFSNGRYTPPAGRYLLFGSAVTGWSGGAIQTFFFLRKNGVTVQQSWETPSTSTYYATNKLEAILDANGTDYFDFTLYGNAAGGTYQGVYIGATPVTGLTGPQGPAGPANPSNVLRGFLSGGVHSSAGSTQALTIGAVAAADSTNSVWINSTVAFTKFIAGGWVAGNGSAVGGMGPGLALSVNTWYFPFAAIINGAFDVFFDNSVTPTHIPAGTTAYRRLRPIKTDASGNILAHTGKGDLTQWNTAIRDIASYNLSSVGSLTQVMPSVPPTPVMVQGRINASNSTGVFYVDVLTPGQTGQNAGVLTAVGGGQTSAFYSVLSDATGALKFQTGGGTSNTIWVDTYGWIDECGRHD